MAAFPIAQKPIVAEFSQYQGIKLIDERHEILYIVLIKSKTYMKLDRGGVCVELASPKPHR